VRRVLDKQVLNMAETIKEIASQLSRIFRHMLPGLVVIGAARVGHPKWFPAAPPTQATEIVVLAAIAMAVGNVWYIFHRYTIHQFIDWILYMRRTRRGTGYLNWLSGFIDDSFRATKNAPEVTEHLHFRSAQIILMFIVSEVIFVFLVWHEPNTVFANHQTLLWMVDSVGFIAASVQYCIGDSLHRAIVEKHKGYVK